MAKGPVKRLMECAATAAVTAVGAALLGCAQPRYLPMPDLAAHYDEQDHEVFRAAGKGVVSGQAFLRQSGGGVVTCAGEAVVLLPDTAYFRSKINVTLRGIPSPFAEEAKSLPRRGQCDAQGNFRFNSVPAGHWLLMTSVRWQAGGSPQGGEVWKAIEVRDDDAQSVLLTDADRYRL